MNDLLEKYWNGDTTLVEEQKLRTYFSSENVSPEHEVYRSVFNTFELEQVMEEGDFDAFAKVKQKQSQDNKFQKKTWKGLAIAAGFALLMTVGAGYYNNQSQPQPDLGTYETPEEAREAALNMLELVSAKFNKGRNNMAPINTLDNKTASVFNLK
ncbi:MULTISPECIES: hypothetical protein [Nonlabens]|uniref:Uncharacterized protein n=1 Tax=Nonlabens xylanidelens TaxID=191564 RepID=A0A2S6IIA5_9FLAO|nr:hypothetical protein [Nonlabens xylanidelens]PPK93953.1 hypothetical protein LY01_02175 [Nonlabens xylanidelens]PQJ22109.1 hypothetical protein BST94_00595 [Nonlabens xylanidelens]